MSLLKMLLDAQNGGAVQQMAQNFGLDQNQASSAISKLVPALTGAVAKNAGAAGGLDSLVGALKSGNHQRYLDNPSELLQQGAVDEGNGILGHLLGSKDASRAVAHEAAAASGVDEGILKKMLPMVAAMTMGGMSKQTQAGAMLGQLSGAAQGSDIGGMLSKFLDSDGDGSIADNLMGMAKKFF